LFAGLEPRRVPQSANLTAGLNVKGADNGGKYLYTNKIKLLRRKFFHENHWLSEEQFQRGPGQ